MAERRVFGVLPGGATVEEVTIAAGELTAKVITLGAIVRDVRLARVGHPLVLGFDDLDGYLNHSPYFGAVVGRFANRIGGGRFTLDGRTYQLPVNERGLTHLHGGPEGFGRRNWRIVAQDAASVTLQLTSPDGEMGYPGTVVATCRYAVEAPATLRFDADATTDAATIVNLAQHSYFNLDGSTDILDHLVRIDAEAITATDENLVPTGEIRPVAGTAHDRRAAAPIRRIVDGKRFVYDINYVVASVRAAEPRHQARLESPRSGIALDVWSTEPGVQFYDGAYVNVAAPGLDGRRYGPNSGCCFESQLFPDAPNHEAFPSAVLRPGETYRQRTRFVFSRP
ncbi:MAG TPA: aldose epimerase family protein [Bauldia sp.]|nr:aldose epimerase family protein [Bauldia sp.]